MKYFTGLFLMFSFLSASSAVYAQDSAWAEKRVNQHMMKVGIKMYHEKKNAEAQRRNTQLDSQAGDLQIHDQKPDLSGLEMEGVSYGIDDSSSDGQHLLESPLDEVSDRTQEKMKAESDYQRARKAYLKEVRRAFDEAGINAEVDENYQVHTESSY